MRTCSSNFESLSKEFLPDGKLIELRIMLIMLVNGVSLSSPRKRGRFEAIFANPASIMHQ